MSKQKKKTTSPKYESTTNVRTTNSKGTIENRISYFVISAFAFLLYANTIGHGFVMDDGAVITNHETVKKGIGGIKELFGQSSVYGSTKENFGTYRPLTMSLFAIEYSFFKENSSAYHFVHVLLYAVLCVILFILLKKLLKDYHPLLPFIATLLFVAHPIHTEVSANIKSADEILSLMFCSLTLLFSLRFIETSAKKFLAFSFLSFLGALFSKESGATFILIIPLALFFFTSARLKNILIVAGVLTFGILVYFLARNSALDPNPPPIGIINNTLAGADTFSERYATIFVILFKYLQLLFFPHPLCWDYGYNQIPLVGFGNPMAIVSVLIYLAMGVYAVAIVIKKIKSPLPPLEKGTSTALISFCVLFYLIGLSVSSNIFILIGSTMAERFLFTPSLAFCVLLAFALIKLFKIESLNIKLVPFAIILVLFSYKTFSRNKDWESNLTLFAKGAEDCPNSYRTNTTFAWESVLAGEKEIDKEKKKIHLQNAITYYEKGLATYPNVDADWYNYGVSNSNLGKVDEAVNAYKRALAINPKHRNSLYNLATVYLSRKDFKNALNCFLSAYKIEPDFMDISFKVGLIYHMTGNPMQAIPYYERYLKNNPTNKDVINNLSMAYTSLGQKEKANELFMRIQQK